MSQFLKINLSLSTDLHIIGFLSLKNIDQCTRQPKGSKYSLVTYEQRWKQSLLELRKLSQYHAWINFRTIEDNERNHMFIIEVIEKNKYSKWE